MNKMRPTNLFNALRNLISETKLYKIRQIIILPEFLQSIQLTWWFSDRASWIDYILITNLMHWLLFIHKILFSSPSTCFEPQVLIKSYDTHQQPSTSSQFSLKLCIDRPPRTLIESDGTMCCRYTTVSSWRWALEARNMRRKIIFYE